VKAKTPGAVTDRLQAWSRGEPFAVDGALRLVYDELRRLAARHLRRERSGHSLQTTALVHEAYLRLAGQRGAEWPSRGAFYAAAAQIMRHILVDQARRRRAAKRGGPGPLLSLDEVEPAGAAPPVVEVIELDRALAELAELDPKQARLVELRFFGGMSIEETADLLGVSEATVKRDWRTARAWLHRRLTQGRAAGAR
jgi:RNA polymerase sigma factor (TIGR02999 family)